MLPAIESLSPMRDKEALEGEKVLGEGYTNYLCTQDAICSRDSLDIRRADLLLVNLLGATEPSQGTIWELGFAKGLSKTCIVVMEPSGNPMDRYFNRFSANVRLDNLPEAVDYVRSFLLPG